MSGADDNDLSEYPFVPGNRPFADVAPLTKLGEHVAAIEKRNDAIESRIQSMENRLRLLHGLARGTGGMVLVLIVIALFNLFH